MKAETPSINGVFKNSTIMRIPFFQRQYVWEEEQWERFANDMEALVGLRKKYFLGSLIFKNEEPTDEEAAYGVSEKYTVIDGQQRLTTLSIYLKALHSFLIDDQLRNNFQSTFFIQDGQHNPVLCHSINDRPAYQEVMWGNPLNAYQDKKIVEAYNFFRNKMIGRGVDELRALWMAVFAHIKFVAIVLDDQDDEQQIFDTINSLGVDLTIDELMKNFLYDVDEEDAYVQNWKPVFDDKDARDFWGTSDAARRQLATDDNKVITNFFYDFVRIKMWDYEKQRGFDRKGFVQKSLIFSTCKAFHELFHADKQELANEIIEYAKLYKKYFNKEENLNVRIPKTPGIERIACVAMAKDATIIPYLLYILKNVDDLQERNRIFGFLETYLVRRMVSLSVNANKMSNEFYPEQLIAKRIDTYDKLREYIMSISEDKNMHMPSDNEIAMNIHQIVFSDESTPRLVFYLQETKNNYQSTGGYNYFLAEYIIPKPARANEINYPPHTDDMLEQERKTRTKTIGNFLLLEKPRYTNNSDMEKNEQEKMLKALKRVINEPFESKKEVLQNYISTIVCSNWFKDKNNWSEDDIQIRNRGFASKVIPQIWPL